MDSASKKLSIFCCRAAAKNTQRVSDTELMTKQARATQCVWLRYGNESADCHFER